jgi:uncharacterized protein (TIGR02466 family)
MPLEPISFNNVTPLFAVPLCHTRIEPVSDIIVDHLTNKVEYDRLIYSNAKNSSGTFILDNPICAPLKTALTERLENFLHGFLDVDIKHKFRINTSWMNQYLSDDYSGEHYHSNSLISGVLYLSDVEDTGDIIFHKDKHWNNVFPDAVRIDHAWTPEKFNVFNAQGWALRPKKWDVVFFPSWLTHSVGQNKSNPKKLRYTLAFNTWVSGQVGDSTSTLVL